MTTTELLAALRATTGALRAAVATAGKEGLERRLAEGWTARQVLAHLADFELVAAVRVRTVLSVDRPTLASYGQDEFTDRFADVETAGDAVERFAVNRRATVRVLEEIGEQEWERTGVHPTRGEEPLRRTVEMLVRHDQLHLDQLRAAAAL